MLDPSLHNSTRRRRGVVYVVSITTATLCAGCATSKVLEAERIPKERIVRYDNGYAYEGQFILPYAVERAGGKPSAETGDHPAQERWISMSLQEVDKAQTQFRNDNPPHTIHNSLLPESVKTEGSVIPVTVYPQRDDSIYYVVIYLPPTHAAQNIRIREPIQRSMNPVVLLLPFAVAFDIATSPIQLIWAAWFSEHLGGYLIPGG